MDCRRGCARLAEDGPKEMPASPALSQWRLLRAMVCEPVFLLRACGASYLLPGDRHAWPCRACGVDPAGKTM